MDKNKINSSISLLNTLSDDELKYIHQYMNRRILDVDKLASQALYDGILSNEEIDFIQNILKE